MTVCAAHVAGKVGARERSVPAGTSAAEHDAEADVASLNGCLSLGQGLPRREQPRPSAKHSSRRRRHGTLRGHDETNSALFVFDPALSFSIPSCRAAHCKVSVTRVRERIKTNSYVFMCKKMKREAASFLIFFFCCFLQLNSFAHIATLKARVCVWKQAGESALPLGKFVRGGGMVCPPAKRFWAFRLLFSLSFQEKRRIAGGLKGF